MNAPPPLSGTLLGARSFDKAAMMTRVAQDADIDEMGHVNNAVYLVWAQDIAVAHWSAIADDTMRLTYLWVALRHEIDYREQVLAGEAVEVRTWLGAAAGPRFIRNIDIRKPGASRPCAAVQTTWCLVDAKSRKPRRVSSEILAAFGVDGR